MQDFVAHVLRRYYAQTEWNPYNSYLYLNSSSQAVLDFSVPVGLSLSISASPSPPFFTSYRLRALPQLTGALGYIFASIEDNEGNVKPLDIGGSSRDIRLKSLVDCFHIIDAPRKPVGKEQVWYKGYRMDHKDYFLYGCMHIPSARVDALVATRLSPTWQLLATAISMPPRNTFGLSPHTATLHSLSEKSSETHLNNNLASSTNGPPGPPPGVTNLHINLQQDTGKWFTEYSYSVDDGLLGFRVLHNFGQLGSLSDSTAPLTGEDIDHAMNTDSVRQRIDEENAQENAVGGGLQGRFSVGGEIFVSPLEKSAGLSTGVRFTTLPENDFGDSATQPSTGAASVGLTHFNEPNNGVSPSQPPTTITATLNPMMGHLGTAYVAQMTRDIVACSRFDFNVYSYDSELTLGAEYWLRSNKSVDDASVDENNSQRLDKAVASVNASSPMERGLVDRQLYARQQSGLSLRDSPPSNNHRASLVPSSAQWTLRDEDQDPGSVKESDSATTTSEQPTLNSSSGNSSTFFKESVIGILKGRISTTGMVALLWESRLRNCLVSVGIRGDLSASSPSNTLSTTPLRSVGVDVLYFSQSEEQR